MELLGAPEDQNKDLDGLWNTKTVAQGLRAISGPLLRQIRRFQTLDICLEALTPKLVGHCAPYDVRILPGTGGQSLSTVFWYVASGTVEAALESRKRDMLRQINETSVQLVEDFHYEQVSADRIGQQLNILSARPD